MLDYVQELVANLVLILCELEFESLGATLTSYRIISSIVKRNVNNLKNVLCSLVVYFSHRTENATLYYLSCTKGSCGRNTSG